MLTSDKITNLNWSLHNFKVEERSSLNKAVFELHQFQFSILNILIDGLDPI